MVWVSYSPTKELQMDDQILVMHAQGKTAVEIAKVLGVSRITINNHARKLGINFPKGLGEEKVRELMNERKQEIIDRYTNGENNRKIAKSFRCKPEIVTTILAEWGVEIRKRPSNWGKLPQYEQQIKDFHNQGLSVCQIASRLGFDPSSVENYCNKLGLEFAKKVDLDDYAEEIVEMRKKKYSTRMIAKHFNLSHGTIRRWLIDNKYSSKAYKIPVDETFFEQIDNEDKAYCLGLMMSDGCVSNGSIRLIMTDKDTVLKFARALRYEGNITEILPKKENHKVKYQCVIYSMKLFLDIQKFGVVQKKSLILEFPKLSLIPANLVHHVVRGILDGDGCIAQYKKRKAWKIVFAGTFEVLRVIEQLLDVKAYYHHAKKANNTWHLGIRIQKEIIKSLEWMYKDATIYMDRKKLKADICLADLRSRS